MDGAESRGGRSGWFEGRLIGVDRDRFEAATVEADRRGEMCSMRFCVASSRIRRSRDARELAPGRASRPRGSRAGASRDPEGGSRVSSGDRGPGARGRRAVDARFSGREGLRGRTSSAARTAKRAFIACLGAAAETRALPLRKVLRPATARAATEEAVMDAIVTVV